MARGGTAAPERYTHMDGGVYKGSWRGGRKEGLGVYTYPSGARYEGRWENNLKHGLGIYYYPKACGPELSQCSYWPVHCLPLTMLT